MKLNKIFLVFLLSLSLFIFPIKVEAKTLRDVYNELDALEQEIEDNKNAKEKTEQEIANATAEINTIAQDLVQLDKDVLASQEEQEQLGEEVVSKKDEIEYLMKYYQVSSGENEYIEYVFGASSVTDFIHRSAVVEELTEHNNTLINEMKQAIEEEKRLVEELKRKEIEMQEKQQYLRNLKVELYSDSEELDEEGLTIEEEIESTREMIDLYKDTCGLDEDIAVCSNKLPPDTSFWRPLLSGYVTSEYGWRLHPTRKEPRLHSGIDIGVEGAIGVQIYASAAGKVSYITYHNSCGGNQVYINHRINGQTYTTVYMHMDDIYVSKGDIVSKNDVIGTVGGSRSVTPWDYCSTGQHLHFGIYEGITTSSSYSMNPRIHVNFPSSKYVTFYDRTTRYN